MAMTSVTSSTQQVITFPAASSQLDYYGGLTSDLPVSSLFFPCSLLAVGLKHINQVILLQHHLLRSAFCI